MPQDPNARRDALLQNLFKSSETTNKLLSEFVKLAIENGRTLKQMAKTMEKIERQGRPTVTTHNYLERSNGRNDAPDHAGENPSAAGGGVGRRVPSWDEPEPETPVDVAVQPVQEEKLKPLCPLTIEGNKKGWNNHAEFMAIYNQGPPLVEDLGPDYYRPWVTGIDPRFH